LRASFSQLLAFELGEESVFLLLFLFFPDFTTGWPRASGVGERGGGEEMEPPAALQHFHFRFRFGCH